MPKSNEPLYSREIPEIQRVLHNADILLFEIEDAVHKGHSIPDAKEIQRLSVLIAARYASAAAMLFSIIRHQEEQQNLRNLQEQFQREKQIR